VEDLVGPKLMSSQEIDLFPVACSFELGYDGKEERFAWDCFEMESGFSLPLPVRVATLARRKKRKRLRFLCLGVGLGKLGLGNPKSVFGSSVIFSLT
jgi:hypothetical protein